ncbi:nitroreductase family deazaflavin-dependent oxidoreductase [Amycolatopsis sp. cg5]|uniref:nitroreductase family deazaflavin-dependent oxidoreductase n=1 Tax=Amycolatopsis sp. cg5 TaxID=3238802 RepID=UPI003523815E
MSDWNAGIIKEFRENEGKVGGPFEGAPMVLLTTIGAKSGQERTSPLVYLAEGDRLFIIASAAGADKHPAWYHNLLANPTVTLEIGTEKFEAKATPLEGEERAVYYGKQAELMPGFKEYQEKTSRVIPVVELRRL